MVNDILGLAGPDSLQIICAVVIDIFRVQAQGIIRNDRDIIFMGKLYDLCHGRAVKG